MLARCWHLCLLASFCLSVQGMQIAQELEHSLDGGSFTSAGRLVGEFITSSRYSTQQQVLEFERDSLPQGGRAAIAELVKANRLYKLQLRPQPGGNVSVLTSIPARCLASASCREQLEVHMGDKGGILGINYDFAACPCSPEHRERSASLPSSWELKDVVPAVVKRSRRIQPLTLLPFTEGPEGKGKGAKAGPARPGPVVDPATGEVREPPKDERSFLQKNWMIILPIGFLAVQLMGTLSGGSAGGEGGGGQQRGPRRVAAS